MALSNLFSTSSVVSIVVVPDFFPLLNKKELSISVCLFHNRNLLRCRLREQREAASVVDAPPLFSSNNFLRCKVVGACANCPSQPHQQQLRKNCPFSLRNCERERRPTWGNQKTHTSAQRMDDKWSRFQFSVGSCSQPNHGGYLSCFFPYLPTNNLQAGC
jgi:hypothetical protein